MKRKSFIVVGLLFSILAVGCAPQKMYNFGNYSQTLYAFEKNQNEETLLNHKQELEKIIDESKVKGLPVPPGIYAELGYIYLKTNKKSQDAIQLFQAESQLYPESKHLMERLIISANSKENNESSASNQSKPQNTISN
ncbi:DUF4810 domain-containing protein [Desulfuromonas thiophila]|uniref:DUF4810 domain-containing protein n=1 Tax=Desulfuromonas thiophila TaxID=57664 RepID=UPI0024A8EDE2|nr:DUF4810 domain-containing protein [Desulfuromonas thiophila]